MNRYRVSSENLKQIRKFGGFLVVKSCAGKTFFVHSSKIFYLDPNKPLKTIKSLTPSFVRIGPSDCFAYWTLHFDIYRLLSDISIYLEWIEITILYLHQTYNNIVDHITFPIETVLLKICLWLQVMTPVFSIQRDSRYFPDPERFDPERFSEENKGSRPPCTYLPFGDGPRMCPGQSNEYCKSNIVLNRSISLVSD